MSYIDFTRVTYFTDNLFQNKSKGFDSVERVEKYRTEWQWKDTLFKVFIHESQNDIFNLYYT